MLTALGFEVTALAARGRLLGQPREVVPPRIHVFLGVALGGVDWLTDVGMGAMSLTSALRFELGAEQITPHDVRRIVREGDKPLPLAGLTSASE